MVSENYFVFGLDDPSFSVEGRGGGDHFITAYTSDTILENK
jgi:hypothetical protein